MPTSTLKDFLDRNRVKYVTVTHSQAYTAHEIAASAHIPAKELAKTVLVKADGKLTMTVLPATHRINFQELQTALGAERVELATEEDFRDVFPGCALGAMPPFGNLYGLEVVVADRLTKDVEIAFNAGTHTELVKLAYSDFERLVKPRVLKFT
ncbi:MAG: YbaK/EbsC family protein [Candidatus Zixiibacteriota bacterium]